MKINYDDGTTEILRIPKSVDPQLTELLMSGGSSYVSVKSYGVKGNGSTLDHANIQKCLNDVGAVGGGTVFFPKGIYLIGATLKIPNNVSIVGAGHGSEIRASGAFPMARYESPGDAFGNRYGITYGLYFNGDNKATIGLELAWVVVERQFEFTQIHNINGKAIQMDNSQNNTFISVSCDSNVIGIAMYNGAGNNKFVRCEFNNSSLYGMVSDSDNTLMGYGTPISNSGGNDFGNIPQGNQFDKCIFERGTATYQVYLKVSKRNLFSTCDFQGGSSAGVFIEIGQPLNMFESKCSWLVVNAIPAIMAKGYRTTIRDCIFEGLTANTDAIQIYNETHVIDNHLSSSFFKLKYIGVGDKKSDIVFRPIEKAGITSTRPNSGDMGAGVPYFDTTLNKPIWYDGTVWRDAAATAV